MIEIERKFLVQSNRFRDLARRKRHIVQGFLCTDPERTVRVRLVDDTGFLTIKGISSATGQSRFEWEQQLSRSEGQSLLALCKKPLVEKFRYDVLVGGYLFEVDEFLGANLGLLLAEVEIDRENEEVPIPDWIGEEVTGKEKYYNSQLSVNPYTTWNL